MTTPNNVDDTALDLLPIFMDQPQVCKLLGIGRSTFYEAVRCGLIPGAFRLGKHIRVNTNVLLATLGGQNEEAVPAGGLGAASSNMEVLRSNEKHS